jgi:endonuclease/exonuclease/phosphatase family metal-dependent hydrolase
MQQKKSRGAQLAVVQTPEGRVHVANWHLGLTEKERHWQAEHLLNHRLFRESQRLPTLIAGDTNDWRNTLAEGALAKHGFVHVTHPVSRFRSFPAWMPVGPLDKLFFRGSVTLRAARIARNALAKKASDHLPLVVDFHLAGGA